jgi:molecular chaperone IbpA
LLLQEVHMTGFDFSPLFRTAIGFDRLARLADSAAAGGNATGYPPYNIERTGEEDYRLTMAVAGFRAEDLDITAQDNTLVITGRVRQEAPQGQMLHRGIAARGFERRFVLADHIVVEGADLRDGMLHVALKPRSIAIGGGAPAAIAGSGIANDTAANTQAA